MILIVVKYRTKPEYTERWPELVKEFTEATRAEPGNLFFEWYRSTDRENEFLLVEMYRDAEAGEKHVNSAHFQPGLETMRPLLTETPEIISKEIEGEGWGPMGELAD